MAAKRILVTGADGFIGSHLTEALVRAGHTVRAFVYYNSFGHRGWLDDSPAEILGDLDVFAGDIRDPNGVREAVRGCDTVLHLAALIGIPFSYHSPDAYVDTNIKGTLNVLQAVRDLGVARLVHTSTSEVYGTAQSVPITEDHPLQGQSPYAATKIAADQLALSFHRSFETPVAILRPFNTYGPRQSARAVLPTIIAGVGIILSIVGVYVVRTREGASQKNLLKALSLGTNLSSFLILIATGALCYYLLNGNPKLAALKVDWWGPWVSIITGLIVGIIIGNATEHYTSDAYAPTQGVAKASDTGPATVIIEGLSVGMLSTWVPALSVAIGTLVAFGFSGGFAAGGVMMGLFGVGIAAVGMLSTLGITLATDAYGPIADNAGANAEMTHQEPYVRERTDALDSLGNTTAAKGKGFAIGSAALTALALMSSYVEEIDLSINRLLTSGGEGATVLIGRVPFTRELLDTQLAAGTSKLDFYMAQYNVTLLNPCVLAGLLIGAMMAFLFCSFTMKAVGRCAGDMVAEVRRQFREIPGIMDGTGAPDYASCVAISTKGAQREMILPSLMAILAPVATGLVLGVAGVLGLLAGALAAGFALAVHHRDSRYLS